MDTPLPEASGFGHLTVETLGLATLSPSSARATAIRW